MEWPPPRGSRGHLCCGQHGNKPSSGTLSTAVLYSRLDKQHLDLPNSTAPKLRVYHSSSIPMAFPSQCLFTSLPQPRPREPDLRVPARSAEWPSLPCVTKEDNPSFAFITMCPADGIPKFGCSNDLFRHGSCVFPPSSNGATGRRCALCLGQEKTAFCWAWLPFSDML
jgi:hypothetical protein